VGAGFVPFMAAGVLNGLMRFVNNSAKKNRKNFASLEGVKLWCNSGE